MPDKHLSSQFDADLNSLSSRLLEMGGLVESQISTAMRAFTQMDIETCNIVIQNEKLVNALYEAREQITRLGADVLPGIRGAVSWKRPTEKGTTP